MCVLMHSSLKKVLIMRQEIPVTGHIDMAVNAGKSSFKICSVLWSDYSESSLLRYSGNLHDRQVRR